MIKDLFINSTILISAIFLAGNFYKEKSLSKNSPLKKRIMVGLFGGVLGIILMFFSIKLTDTMITDFRHLPVLIITYLTGFIPAMISSLIIGLFRVLYFGVSKASVIGVINIITIALGASFINSMKIKNLSKWIYMNVYSIVNANFFFYMLLKGTKELKTLSFSFWTIGLLTAILVYYLMKYVEESNDVYRKYKEEAKKDFLTGLNNVRQFDNIYNNLSRRVKENNEKLSILMLDIDHFKNVNDTYGHKVGDMILSQLGKLLIDNCRPFDFVSRMGGEEFSILLPDCAHGQALQVAEKIRIAIENNEFSISNEESINITISIGVSTVPDSVDKIEKLIEDSDEGLYLSKRTGRNKVSSVYNEKYSRIAVTKG